MKNINITIWVAVFLLMMAVSLSVFTCIDVMKTSPVSVSHETKTSDGTMKIVIDPGHGGIDGGAVSRNGIEEKHINLQIAQCLAKEMRGYPVEVMLTRTEDVGLYEEKGQSIRQKKREDLLKRKEIFEEEGVMLGVSIHLNSYPQDEKVYGAQVFYAKQKNGGTDVFSQKNLSKEIAETVQESIEINIQDGRERKAMPKDNILIFENSTVNLILVECGFLSNPREAEVLQTVEYQQKLAHAIWKGINEKLCLEKTEKIEIVDSCKRR